MWIAAASATGVDIGKELLEKQIIERFVPRVIRRIAFEAGAEVAELYLGFPSTAGVPQPPKPLKGFERVELKPGQTGHVHLVVDGKLLSYWNTARDDWAVMPGDYKVMVGASSRDISLQGQFSVN